MAKSKYAPALFEVITSQKTAKTTSRLSVPKWWRSLRGRSSPAEEGEIARQTQPLAPTEDTDAAQTDSIASEPLVVTGPVVMDRAPETSAAAPASAAPHPVEEPGAAAVATSETATAPIPPAARSTTEIAPAWARSSSPPATKGIDLFGGSERRPIFRTDSGRIEISLNPVTAAVAAGVLLLALFTSYQIGRGLAPAGTAAADSVATDDISKALQQKPDPDALNVGASTSPLGGAAKPAASGAETEATGGQTSGLDPRLHYVILDNYGDNRDAAEFVRKWLAETHGIETLPPKRMGGKLVLVSAVGFDYSDPAQVKKCEDYVARIKSLGRDCMAELGKAKLPRYGFADPLVRRLQEK